ncbi:MAG TPA: hypothetical protein VMW50_08245 [Dehalococcoidia bacterium]|nr:hypothetical protein [Dehalococcoidia bacterium]
MQDQYGQNIPDDLVRIPDYTHLIDEEIKLVANADWYEVFLADDRTLLCVSARAIDYLSEEGDFSHCCIAEILRVNDVLKRWSEEDGFYSA